MYVDKAMREVCSGLTIKTPEKRYSTVDFE